MWFGLLLVRFILCSQQGANIRARMIVITVGSMCERQFVGIVVVAGIQSKSLFQVGEPFSRLSLIDEQFPESLVCVKASRLVFSHLAQRFFHGRGG